MRHDDPYTFDRHDGLNRNSVRSIEETQALLFNRTMGVLCGMNAISFFGSWLTAEWQPTVGGLIGLFVVALALIFGTTIWAKVADEEDPTPLIGIGLFALVEGMSIGPVLTLYAHTLGTAYVSYASAIVVAATALFGGLGSVLTFSYAKVESILMFGLMGLIAFLFGSMVFQPPPGVDIAISGGAAAMFCAFLVVDFARLRDVGRQTAGWGTAGLLAMKIYLDMINLLLWVLKIMGKTKSKD